MDWKTLLQQLADDPEQAGFVASLLRTIADIVEKNPKGLIAFLRFLKVDFQ